MSIIKRKCPRNVEPISFRFNNDENFGMLNLSGWRNEMDRIKNHNHLVITDDTINIHFPMYDNYYVKTYTSSNGFTFKKLVDRIIKAGLATGNYIIKYDNRTLSVENPNPSNYIMNYAIASSNDGEDIKRLGNNIYISIQS